MFRHISFSVFIYYTSHSTFLSTDDKGIPLTKGAMEEEELTVLEVAEEVGVHLESVKRWIKLKELKATKKGLQWFIKSSDLEAFQLNRKRIADLKKADTAEEELPKPAKIFAQSVGRGLVKLLKGEPICLVAILPDGPFYAGLCKDYLELKNIDAVCINFDISKGEEFLLDNKDTITGRKLLIVDNATHSGHSYEIVALWLLKLEAELKFKYFFEGLEEFFEEEISPNLFAMLNGFNVREAAKKIPLAVYEDNKQIAAFYITRESPAHRYFTV